MAASAPFDPSRARFATVVVSVDSVIDLLRVSHDTPKIGAYRDAMERGERFPPVSGIRIARRIYLADGHKRLVAARRLGVTEIPIELWTVGHWLRDQRRQLRTSWRRLVAPLVRAPRDPAARADLHRAWADWLGHCKRIARSARPPKT